MLRLWMQTMSGAGLDADAIECMRAAYARDVAILPPDRVAELVAQAGFEAPLRFHQAGMIHGWCARRGCECRCGCPFVSTRAPRDVDSALSRSVVCLVLDRKGCG